MIDVAPSSPAKKAGILGGDNTTNINGRPITLGGDIILKIDNKDIQNIHDILAYIESKKNVGDSILVTVLRDGIIQFNPVKLGSNPNYLQQDIETTIYNQSSASPNQKETLGIANLIGSEQSIINKDQS